MAGRQSFAVTIYGVSAADQHVHGWDARRASREMHRQTDQERETLPVTSDKKGALSIARRRTR